MGEQCLAIFMYGNHPQICLGPPVIKFPLVGGRKGGRRSVDPASIVVAVILADPPADQTCRPLMLAITWTVIARITIPNRYDTNACCNAVTRIGRLCKAVSVTP